MTTASLPQTSDDDSVEQEMVQLIANSAHRVPLPVFILAVCLAATAAGRIPVWIAMAWLSLAVCVIALRYYVFRSLPNRKDLSAKQRFNRVIALNVVGGLTYSLVYLVFPMFSDAERAFATIVLVGLATCAVITTSCKMVGALAYIGPIMTGMALAWALVPRDESSTMVETILPALVFLYSLILVGLAKEVNRSIVESWTIRLRERDLNQKLTSALQVAENASNAKTRFLAAASHDLRQPLHTISTLGSALSLRPVDVKTREIIDFLNTVTASFTSQLEGLLDVSKLDAGIVQAEFRTVNVANILHQHAAEISAQTELKGLQLRVDVPSTLVVRTDPVLFLRVLGNLTQNAIKFTQKGQIAIEARQVRDKILLTISDTGIGIAAAQQNKVFQEFYQVDNPERDRSQGLGLGLSIVNRLVQLLDIQMEMYSVVGQGTRFSLLLPFSAEPVEEIPLVKAPAVQPKNLRVLVVDDEQAVRAGLRLLLEELHCVCVEASGTEEAIQAVESMRPDLLLADFRLRGTDNGINTIRAVQSRWPDTYAVLVSGDTAPDRLLEAENAGIRLIHKPLGLDSLKHLLSTAHLTSPESSAVHPAESGGALAADKELIAK